MLVWNEGKTGGGVLSSLFCPSCTGFIARPSSNWYFHHGTQGPLKRAFLQTDKFC